VPGAVGVAPPQHDKSEHKDCRSRSDLNSTSQQIRDLAYFIVLARSIVIVTMLQ